MMTRIWRRLASLTLLSTIVFSAIVFSPILFAAEEADYVFTNAKVYTVNPQQPWAEAVAVKGNKIVYVGDRTGIKGKGMILLVIKVLQLS